jgi:Uncharacterised nucleotidyltransferase
MPGLGKTASVQPWLGCQQVKLLQAALSTGPAVHDAFNHWRTTTGWSQYAEIDAAASDLLPLVYGALSRAQLSDPWLLQLAGLHRYYWVCNAERERRYLELFAGLEAASVEFVVLGSFAWRAAGYYDNLGERPKLDARMVIAPHARDVAACTLNSLGWHWPGRRSPVAGWQDECWRMADQLRLDVGYRWLPKGYAVVGLDRLFAISRTVTCGNISLRILDAAGILLHACVCQPRAASGDSAKMLWVADIMRLLQRETTQIDWQRLHDDAVAWQALTQVQTVLSWLRNNFAACAAEVWPIASQSFSIPDAAATAFGSTAECKPRPFRVDGWINSWNRYSLAEQAAERTPTLAGWLRFCSWRITREIGRLVPSRQ